MRLASLEDTRDQLKSAWLRRPPIAQETDTASHAGPPSRPSLFIARAGATAAVAFLVGTGGLGTASYITERNQRGYRLEGFECGAMDSRKQQPALEVRTASDNLARVKTVFQPSVTELASLFNVSRQTIYNWQAGQAIAPENEQRLAQLALAADLLEAHGLAGKLSVLRRAIRDGKNLLDLVREGGDPLTLATGLVDTIRHELEQRKRLDARFANRQRKPVDLDDVGLPHSDERA